MAGSHKAERSLFSVPKLKPLRKPKSTDDKPVGGARLSLRAASALVAHPDSPLRKNKRFKVAVVAAPLAMAATIGSVSLGVVSTGGAPAHVAGADTRSSQDSAADIGDRENPVSRSGGRSNSPALSASDLAGVSQKLSATAEKREQATDRAIKNADTKLWTTEDLNLWSAPEKSAEQQGELDSGDKVLVTGRSQAGRDEVVVDGKSLWVTAGYLDDEEPLEGLGGECTAVSIPSGISPNIAATIENVCARFPSISTYGTLRGGGGDHGAGRAVDIMVSGSTGWEVAEFVRANAAALNVNYVIYSQQIWSVERSGEGWRAMSDRGSVTANHYDHVHVSSY